MGFAGLRVLSLESRRASEMNEFILREGGVPFVAASVKERSVDDSDVAVRFVEGIEGGEIDMVVCMTGAGLTLLQELCARRMPLPRLTAALRSVTIVSRGPKPVPVLRELGVQVDILIPEPNTWREFVQAVAGRPERRIAVQEYGRINTGLHDALRRMGAEVISVSLYRWDMPDDLGPLREAARRIAHGEVDVVLFTSSVQLDHLLATARSLNLEPQVRERLASEVVVCSVGPVMTEALEAEGLRPDVIPRHPKMWALVKAASQFCEDLASRERQVSAR